ncbi:MAG TPA: HepT-like ribonuclease domain-containing protein [Thermoplasmata archaeon]|nr:HepT-like ribonuclease domain-containing protein [Thermoplasmata archaeon]
MTDRARLADVLERIDRILRATREGKQEFYTSEVIQDAVIRNLEVIGEAAKQVSRATRRRLSEVPWRETSRFRDLAIHHYGKILAEEIWTIVEKDLVPIRRAIQHGTSAAIE